jgi:hypothetical protein
MIAVAGVVRSFVMRDEPGVPQFNERPYLISAVCGVEGENWQKILAELPGIVVRMLYANDDELYLLRHTRSSPEDPKNFILTCWISIPAR